MKLLLRFFVYAPLAVILIAISVANRNTVQVSFDPFSATDPAILLNVPLYWIIFACIGIGILMGGSTVWFKQGRFRKEARDQKFAAAVAKTEAKKSQEQIKLLTNNPALPAPRGG